MLVAIGAAVAVLTGIGAGLGIGLATGKQIPSSWLCTGRGNRYLRFRYRSADHLLPWLITITEHEKNEKGR